MIQKTLERMAKSYRASADRNSKFKENAEALEAALVTLDYHDKKNDDCTRHLSENTKLSMTLQAIRDVMARKGAPDMKLIEIREVLNGN